MRGFVVAIVLGLMLVCGSLGGLIYTYGRSLFGWSDSGRAPISIEAQCETDNKKFATLFLPTPHILQERVPVGIHLSSLSSCKTLQVNVPRGLAGVHIAKPDALAKEPEVGMPFYEAMLSQASRLKPSGQKDGEDIYKIDLTGQPHSSVIISNAFTAYRMTLDTYGLATSIFLSRGTWDVSLDPRPEYQLFGGAIDYTQTYDQWYDNARFAPLGLATVKFAHLDALSEVAAIVLSTILGIGISLTTTGLSGLVQRRS